MAGRVPVDFSFQRYVDRQRRPAGPHAGAGYAYAGDLRVLRTLGAIKPVTLAVEASVRVLKAVRAGDLLGSAVQVGPGQFPRLHALAERAADTLGIPLPALFVAPRLGALDAHTLGTEADAFIVLSAALVDHLTDDELLFVIGHECGHVQNEHVVYQTALWYLRDGAAQLLRWVVKPAALALSAWARRAEITGDRAGLLCVGDLDIAVRTLVKLALGSQRLYAQVDVDEYLRQFARGAGRVARLAELDSSHPYLPRRVEALRLFAESAAYRAPRGLPGGLDAAACDAKVARLLSLFGDRPEAP